MKVRLLALNVDKSIPFTRFQARVVSSIKSYIDSDASFEYFENMKGIFLALQSALENDELILLASDIKNYLRFKNILIEALGAGIKHDPSVLNMLESSRDMEDEQRRAFSSFPEPAEVFLSKDGLYSGFGIENGSQYLLFVPIDNDRIDLILRNGMVPFLNKYIGDPTENGTQESEYSQETEKIRETVRILIQSGYLAAVNGTENAEVLKSCGDCVENFDDVFVFTPHVEDKGEVNVTEYAAQLAKVSLDLSAANIGASISDIYTAGDTKYLCIAVANDESAVVRKLYMSDDETDSEFVKSAAIELIELIGEKAAGLQSIGIEISDGVKEAPQANEKKSTGKKPMIVSACVLGAIVVICAVLGIVYKVQGENGAFAQTLRSIFGGEPTTEDAAPPVENDPTTEPTTEAQPSAMKLSDFMMLDLINLERNRFNAESTTAESTTGSAQTEPETQKDTGAPLVIKINGQNIEAKEALARLVMTEMGDGYDIEAIKAQTVVIYTYLKYRDTNFEINGVTLSDTYNDEVMSAVEAVFGEYLTYNGEVALTPYFQIAADKTAGGSSVFEGDYPYLKSVQVNGNPDISAENYRFEKTYSLGELKGILLDFSSALDLSDEPLMWITVAEHDAAVSSSIGYVTKVNVGGVEMSGLDFCTKVIGTDNLPSHCFTVFYDDATSEFTFTAYGKGFGVGMSQTGANHLASRNTNYSKILSTYFNGTTLSKEANV
ncbi:MAG: SpoIID/LytB domain-containing protein [Oscillospiraceae bacterium]|nr:SpoIID/LytB domain-containing protein [Oscillospiraceae bacterium]